MSTLSVRLPDSLHETIKKMSKQDHISINQFIASAVAEKITAFETEDYIGKRAAQGKKELFLNILKKVPDVRPDENDVRKS